MTNPTNVTQLAEFKPEPLAMVGTEDPRLSSETVDPGEPVDQKVVMWSYPVIQDGLIYTVPEFDSWFPTYQPRDIPGRQAEPLGFARWTAPLIAQTELRPGDTLILTSQDLGRALAEEMANSGLDAKDLSRWHHRDPDRVLDFTRQIVIDRDMSANLCRCGTYTRIRKAIHSAASKMAKNGGAA